MQCHLIVIIATPQGRYHCHTILQIRKQRPSAQVYPGRASVGVLTHALYCLSNFQTTRLLTRELVWLTSTIWITILLWGGNQSVHTAHSQGIHTCTHSSIQAILTEVFLCVRQCSRSSVYKMIRVPFFLEFIVWKGNIPQPNQYVFNNISLVPWRKVEQETESDRDTRRWEGMGGAWWGGCSS